MSKYKAFVDFVNEIEGVVLVLFLPLMSMTTGIIALKGHPFWAVVTCDITLSLFVAMSILLFCERFVEGCELHVIAVGVNTIFFVAMSGHDWIFTYPLLAKLSLLPFAVLLTAAITLSHLGTGKTKVMVCRLFGHSIVRDSLGSRCLRCGKTGRK